MFNNEERVKDTSLGREGKQRTLTFNLNKLKAANERLITGFAETELSESTNLENILTRRTLSSSKDFIGTEMLHVSFQCFR